MKHPTTTLRTLRANASLTTEQIALAATATVVLVLLAYLFGLWPVDVLGIELSVAEALLPLVAALTLLWFVLRRCRRAEEKARAMERKAVLAADYSLCIEDKKVLRGTKEIHLAPHEFRLLRCLLECEGQICEYSCIIEEVWPEESRSPAPPGRENLAALVRRLRDKITVHDYIKNHPSRGYELVQWER